MPTSRRRPSAPSNGTDTGVTPPLIENVLRDPHFNRTNRVFEVPVVVPYDNYEETPRIRIRFDTGSFFQNCFGAGDELHFHGMISSYLGGGRWSAYGWGAIPAGVCFYFRELHGAELREQVRLSDG